MNTSLRTTLLILVASVLTLTSTAQLKILSGIDKGTYNHMATDMKSVGGNLEIVDTVREKIPIYNDLGSLVSEKDTMYTRTNTETFLTIRTSGGSIDNYRQMVVNRSTGMDVTFMQYDVLLYNELKKMKVGETKDDNIRILCPLGTEEIHLVTRQDSYIERLKDLKNMRVSIGTKQMGSNITCMFIQEITGIKFLPIEYDLERAFRALLSDQIDAFFFVGSAPVKRLTELSSLLKYEIRLIPIEDENLTAYYTKSVIPAGTYPWSKVDVNTYSVKTALITNIEGESAQKTASIKKLMTDLKDNLPKLQETGHPEWKEVDFNFDGIDWKIHDMSKIVFGLE